MKDFIQSTYWYLDQAPAGASLWVRMLGHLTGQGKSHYNSFPDYFCPHIILKGRGTVIVDGRRAELKAGEMFTLWPGHEFNYFEDTQENWEFYWLHLEGTGTRQFVEACGFREDNLLFAPSDSHGVIRLLEEIYRLLQEKNPSGQYEILANLYRLPLYCRWPDESGGKREVRSLPEVLTIIETMLPRRINVNELCALFGISRVTLFRRFTQEMGVTPIEYINGRRLAKAKELLLTTPYSLATVARMAGYSNEKYFFKIFKITEGLTPTTYRKKFKPIPSLLPG